MEITIGIEGMHCRSCKLLIESELNALEGVDKAEVSLEGSSAAITMSADRKDDIIRAVESLGFGAKVLR